MDKAEQRRAYRRAYLKDYWRRKPEYRKRALANGRKWREANREFTNLRKTLGVRKITLDQYHAKLESQDFLCALCGEAEPKVIDHGHATGRCRGIICWSCNTGLGQFKDSLTLLDKAKAYLVKWT